MILRYILAVLLLEGAKVEAQLVLAEPGNVGVEACGGTIVGALEGEISSPGYPASNYPSNQNCTYIVEAPPDYVIVYNGTFMDLEDQDPLSGLCLYDSVKIFDDSVVSNTFCGQQPIYINATTTNMLRVEFISDFTTEKRGFQLRWHLLKPEERPIQLNCDFDDAMPLCAGWTNENIDYAWHFTREHTPSANTGPVADHTTGTTFGRYAYIEGSKVQRNATAILQSPAIISDTNTNERCVRFWYHMYGSGIGGLAIRLTDSNDRQTLVAEFSGDKGDAWLEGKYTITLRSLMSTVSFEGRRGLNYMSDIALDDISITTGSCDGPDRNLGVGDPVIGVPTLQPLPGINLLPSGCPANLERFNCPLSCDVTCENFFDLVFSSSCERACHGNCACPIDIPVLHEGRCIDFLLCPGVDIVDNITTADTPSKETTSAVITTNMITSTIATGHTPTTTATTQEAITTTKPKLQSGKKEMIHDYLMKQIVDAILARLANKLSKN